MTIISTPDLSGRRVLIPGGTDAASTLPGREIPLHGPAEVDQALQLLGGAR